jgi:hypothetical protein
MKTKTSTKAQGMSINIVIIIVLALLALVLVGYFVISGFGEAGSGVSSTSQSISKEVINEESGVASGIGRVKGLWPAKTIYCCKNDEDQLATDIHEKCPATYSSVSWTSANGCGSCDAKCQTFGLVGKFGSDPSSSTKRCKCYTK